MSVASEVCSFWERRLYTQNHTEMNMKINGQKAYLRKSKLISYISVVVRVTASVREWKHKQTQAAKTDSIYGQINR